MIRIIILKAECAPYFPRVNAQVLQVTPAGIDRYAPLVVSIAQRLYLVEFLIGTTGQKLCQSQQ